MHVTTPSVWYNFPLPCRPIDGSPPAPSLREEEVEGEEVNQRWKEKVEAVKKQKKEKYVCPLLSLAVTGVKC